MLLLGANSPRVPLPPGVSKWRTPSEASSLFVLPDGHKPQDWSLRSPLCPAANCGAKPDFQTGRWLQKPRPSRWVLCLVSQHTGSHRWEQNVVPHPSATSQEAEHGCSSMGGQEQNGSPRYSRGKGFAFFLVPWEWNPPLSFCNSGGVLVLLPLRSVLWDQSQGLHSTMQRCARTHGASCNCINRKKPAFLGHFIYFPSSQGYISENKTLSAQVVPSL